MSVAAIRSYIQQNPRYYAEYFSDLIEAFLFMSNLRFTVIACLFISNVSNFLRTHDPLSLFVNIPSELLLFLYPTLRKRQIIPQGQGSVFCFLFTLMLSLQWSFSFWIIARSDIQALGPTVLTIVLSVLWLFSQGPSALINALKASVCSLLFVSIIYTINPEYVLKIRESLVLGVLLGLGLNQSIDQMMRSRFYIEQQQKILMKKNAKIELIMHASQLIMFTIDDKLLMHSEFSADCVRLFGKESNRIHLDELLSRAELSAADKLAMKSALEAMLGDNEISFAINEHACVKKFRLQTFGEGRRTMLASYAPLLNPEGHIKEILLAIKDVTHMEVQESRQKLASLETESLLILLRAPRDQLEIFMAESQRLLQTLQGDPAHESLLRSLHTFKGNCRTLGFKSLSQLLHEAETALQSGRGLEASVNTINTVLKLLLSVYHERFLGHSEPTSFKHFVEDLAQKAAAEASHLLGKAVPHIHIKTSALPDTPALRKLIFQILPHLVANALDHGIESADERTARGKTPAGNIYLELVLEASIVLRLSDDGRGLALLKLRERMGAGNWSDQDVADTLFVKSHSTRQTVTEISGRGVGLNAVADAIRDVGGRFSIILGDETEPGYRSFKIELQILGGISAEVA